MSYMKRHMDDEAERIADQYHYPYDRVMDALYYAEFDWNKVELMAEARVLSMYVAVCRGIEEQEAVNELQKEVISELKAENNRLKQERDSSVSNS